MRKCSDWSNVGFDCCISIFLVFIIYLTSFDSPVAVNNWFTSDSGFFSLSWFSSSSTTSGVSIARWLQNSSGSKTSMSGSWFTPCTHLRFAQMARFARCLILNSIGEWLDSRHLRVSGRHTLPLPRRCANLRHSYQTLCRWVTSFLLLVRVVSRRLRLSSALLCTYFWPWSKSSKTQRQISYATTATSRDFEWCGFAQSTHLEQVVYLKHRL